MPEATTNPLKRTRRGVTYGWMLAVLLVLAASAGASPRQAGMPRAQKHESRHEIDQLENAWRDAVLNSNTVKMESLLADDYLAITSSGTLQTKEQALDNLRAGRVRFTLLDITDRKVRFYGNTALVTSVAEVQGTAADEDLAGSYRYTRVYVRDAKGAWKIVSFEVSRIREPGERSERK